MLNRGNVLVHSCNEQTMARFLPSRYKVLWALRVSRYKVYWEQVKSQGIQSFKGTKARSRYKVVGPVIRSRIKCKNRDKQMHFIVRVSSFNYFRFVNLYL
jgi:hypothetical protein